MSCSMPSCIMTDCRKIERLTIAMATHCFLTLAATLQHTEMAQLLSKSDMAVLKAQQEVFEKTFCTAGHGRNSELLNHLRIS